MVVQPSKPFRKNFNSISEYENYVVKELKSRYNVDCAVFTMARWGFYATFPTKRMNQVKALVFGSMPEFNVCSEERVFRAGETTLLFHRK